MTRLRFGRVADSNPAIIENLRIIRHSASTAAERRRANDFFDAVLKGWSETESVSQLREKLGVVGRANRRRRQATVNVETDIAMAVMQAALNGEHDPIEQVATDRDINVERVRDAWTEWRGVYIPTVEKLASASDSILSQRAKSAIPRLRAISKR
jgi:hypothetical protein